MLIKTRKSIEINIAKTAGTKNTYFRLISLQLSASKNDAKKEMILSGKKIIRQIRTPPKPPATHKIIEYKTTNKLLINTNASDKYLSLVKYTTAKNKYRYKSSLKKCGRKSAPLLKLNT
jgi:hypothetical protein